MSESFNKPHHTLINSIRAVMSAHLNLMSIPDVPIQYPMECTAE